MTADEEREGLTDLAAAYRTFDVMMKFMSWEGIGFWLEQFGDRVREKDGKPKRKLTILGRRRKEHDNTT